LSSTSTTYSSPSSLPRTPHRLPSRDNIAAAVILPPPPPPAPLIASSTACSRCSQRDDIVVAVIATTSSSPPNDNVKCRDLNGRRRRDGRRDGCNGSPLSQPPPRLPPSDERKARGKAHRCLMVFWKYKDSYLRSDRRSPVPIGSKSQIFAILNRSTY
jgi:hypothetical protein